MPASTTPRTVVVAMHYQNDILHPDGKIRLGFGEGAGHRDAVLSAVGRLLDGARAQGVPIVHVRTARPPEASSYLTNAPIFQNVLKIGACVEGEWGSEFFAGLAPVEGERTVTHWRVNGFYDSALEAQLRSLGATHLVIAGVATNSCVEHTARHAADMGYVVTVAQDACSAARPDVHDMALFNIGLVGRVADVDALVGGNFA